MDTSLADNVKQAIVSIKVTSDKTAMVTGDLSRIVAHVKAGKGTVGALLMDSVMSDNLKQSIVTIKLISDSLAGITGDFSHITNHIKNGKGAIGTILMDTTFVGNLNKSMENVKSGTQGFDENMEALKHNILLRGYFKKQEKKKGKK
jgi:phospholipid/cholesterol/gamma-HCH transport system substrate-binding protein